MKDIDKRKGVHKMLINMPQEGACYVVVKEARHMPLVNALVDRMTPEQLQHTVIECRGVKYIAFPDIVQCFELVGNNEEIDHNVRQCICGVRIVSVYYIYNIDEATTTYNKYSIGCECIKHWSDKVHEDIKRHKKRKDHLEKDPLSTFCFMCNQKTNVRGCPCKNDDEKQEAKQKAFQGWANICREKKNAIRQAKQKAFQGWANICREKKNAIRQAKQKAFQGWANICREKKNAIRQAKQKSFQGWANICREKGRMERIPIGQLVKNKTYYWVLKEQHKNLRIKNWIRWVLDGGLDHDRYNVCKKLLKYKTYIEEEEKAEKLERERANRQKQEEKQEEEIEVEELEINGQKYWMDNGDVYEYIDESSCGEKIGNMVGGTLVLCS